MHEEIGPNKVNALGWRFLSPMMQIVKPQNWRHTIAIRN